MVKQVKKTGSFNFIGLMKMTLVKKPAVKGGKLVRNPFTGEMVKQKPKPASKTVKVRPDEGAQGSALGRGLDALIQPGIPPTRDTTQDPWPTPWPGVSLFSGPPRLGTICTPA